MKLIKNEKTRNAFRIGFLCSLSYLAVYFARNILSTVTPQMIERNGYTTEYIGSVSSLYFIFYAVGQLINGMIGDRIKSRYMISFGLVLAGGCNLLFPYLLDNHFCAQIVYAMTGFFLSMIYAPMAKVVAENTEPHHAVRCSLGFTFSSFFGSPIAGMVAALLAWQSVFVVASGSLFVMGVLCFVVFLCFERNGIIKYNQYTPQKKGGGSIKVLIQNRIIKFTLVSVITGVVRTTVVFWLPTYISQHLGFSAERSAAIFTAATLIISLTAFVAVFIYERLRRNMDLTMLVMFISAAVSFLVVYFVKQPVVNMAFLIIAIMSSNSASSILWSIYCPSLRDTGMVSSVTGFLDFVSYMAAAASSTLFANAVTSIGWGNLIVVWFMLMVCGVVVTLPSKRHFGKRKEQRTESSAL